MCYCIEPELCANVSSVEVAILLLMEVGLDEIPSIIPHFDGNHEKRLPRSSVAYSRGSAYMPHGGVAALYFEQLDARPEADAGGTALLLTRRGNAVG
jgi:hypothetical protein